MKSIQQAVTAPVVINGEDGSAWTFAPITPRILSEFCRYLNGVNKRQPNVLVPFDEMMDAAQTLDGMMWLIWKCGKTHHSTLTQEQVWDIVPSIQTMQELVTALMDIEETEQSDPLQAEAAGVT